MPKLSVRTKRTREKFQRERPSLESLVASGEYRKPIPQPELFMMLELAAALKSARKHQRLSLADVARRSGIDKAPSAVSRMGRISIPRSPRWKQSPVRSERD
jgi:hypothetical protein